LEPENRFYQVAADDQYRVRERDGSEAEEPGGRPEANPVGKDGRDDGERDGNDELDGDGPQHFPPNRLGDAGTSIIHRTRSLFVPTTFAVSTPWWH